MTLLLQFFEVGCEHNYTLFLIHEVEGVESGESLKRDRGCFAVNRERFSGRGKTSLGRPFHNSTTQYGKELRR